MSILNNQKLPYQQTTELWLFQISLFSNLTSINVIFLVLQPMEKKSLKTRKIIKKKREWAKKKGKRESTKGKKSKGKKENKKKETEEKSFV